MSGWLTFLIILFVIAALIAGLSGILIIKRYIKTGDESLVYWPLPKGGKEKLIYLFLVLLPGIIAIVVLSIYFLKYN